MATVHDFDAFRKQREARSPKFTLYNREWSLPPTLRYDGLLAFQRLAKRDKTEQINDEEIFATFETILGTEVLRELRTYPDFDVELATEVTKWALQMYGVTKDNDEESPKENQA